MRIIALALLFAVCLTGADRTQKFGSIEVTTRDGDSGLQIREGSRKWYVDLSQLAKDCRPLLCEDVAADSACPACEPSPGVLGFDGVHRRVYFRNTIDKYSWEGSWEIYSYSLITARISRVAETQAAGFGYQSVSPTGRYVAYLKLHHQSLAGPCTRQIDVEVLDLWNGVLATPEFRVPHSDGCVIVTKLTWSAPSRLLYEAETYDDQLRETGKKSGRLVVH